MNIVLDAGVLVSALWSPSTKPAMRWQNFATLRLSLEIQSIVHRIAALPQLLISISFISKQQKNPRPDRWGFFCFLHNPFCFSTKFFHYIVLPQNLSTIRDKEK